ncbi:serine/threonine-protein kinase [Actinomarinicola tropica]|uniref:Protein kinase domain-containing protein n=1 Tax=Actinomarinicola tropica TaxID=2789776 RepID=A0A5Q2RP51_9ACTN|nr:hypothetical protein [Actinomarinicola tropica]QGG95660.1 hypothetical protein GH723_11445 [Actinomarinicola tropica]
MPADTMAVVPDDRSIEVDATGDRPTVTKTARGPAARRLRVEAAALTAARHPGVVAVVGDLPTTSDDGTVVLRTRFVGSRTLATLGPVEPSRAAALIASLAATVADLHDLGIVHRRLTADHVVVATDGRPVLCGFAEAAQVARPGAATADDVAQLGELLRTLVADAPTELEEPPARRLTRRRSDAHVRGALLNLADQATADEWIRRPTARQFAAAISTTVPGATLPPPPHALPGPSSTPTTPAGPVARRRRSEHHPEEDPVAPPRTPPSLRRPGLLVGSALGTVLLVGLAVPLSLGGADGTPPPPTAPPASTTTTDAAIAHPAVSPTTTTASPPPLDLAGAAGCATVPGTSLAATASGQPCTAAVAFEAGRLTIDGTAFDIGVDPAAIALGDLTCRGEVELAVVDLTTGDVAVFERWARPGEPVQGATVARIDSPRQIVAEPLGDGCHRLAVLDTWGIRHVVDTQEDLP